MNILAQAVMESADKIDATQSVAWYQNPTVLALIGIIAAIFVATFLGRFLSKTFRTPELSGRIGLVLWCIIVSAIIISIKPLKFGVDLRGGVTIIGQMNDQPGVEAQDQVTIQQLIPVLKQRIDPSGVREIVIRGLGTDQMEVIIPDVEKEEAERIWQRLTSAGQLFFRIVADETQGKHQGIIAAARETILDRRSDVFGAPDEENPEGRKIGEWFELAREQAPAGQTGRMMPFKFLPSASHLLRDKQTGEPIDISNQNFGGDMEESRKRFTRWATANGHRSIEILMVHPPTDRQNVEGKYLTSVQKGFDERAQPRIEFKLTGQGGRRLFSLTSRNKPQNNRHFLLGIVLDGKLQSAPRINEPIRTDGVIEGSFTEAEIESYIAVLSSGKLDVALRKNWISMDQIRSTLGEELKTKGLMAIAISLGIVLVFMLFYYRFCGIVACTALILNLVFVVAILMLINVNLTLTGLAGLVLTIGMSVDANVLIFERIREELNRGAALRMAIRNGFDRATTTIVDANLTTLITAVILYVIGTDQLRSFAVTLIVGILMCMFTAIYCSRILFNVAERRRWITELKMNQIVGNQLVDFISMRRVAAVISVLVIMVGLTAFFIRGKGMLDTDLAGGSTARIEFVSVKTVDEITESLRQADYKYMGDPIRYSVTQMKDNEKAFKIDASLPVMDAEEAPGGDPVPKLDEIIADVFTGQLVMLNLEYDPAQVKLLRPDGTPVETPGIVPEVEDNQPGGGGPNMEHAIWAMPQEEPAANQDTTAGTSDSTADPQETEQPELGAPTAQQLESAAEGQQQPATAGRRERFVAEVDLTFAHPITGESVIGYLQTAADELGDVPFDEDDVELKAPGVESIRDRATKWNVKMGVYGESDAFRVFERVQETMAQEPYFASSSGVGGQVAGQTQQKALFAMVASLIGIIGYIWIRFQNVAFGLAAIVALVHDVLVVLGAIAVSYWLAKIFGFLLIEDFRISLSVVAALLTIIGYSLNDTIVVFDRIREVRGKRTDITAEMINRSISQTLSRTILTSITTLLVVVILYVLGGESIHAFAYALVIGVIVGTYSSIFVASPTLLWLMNRGVAPPTVNPEKAPASQG